MQGFLLGVGWERVHAVWGVFAVVCGGGVGVAFRQKSDVLDVTPAAFGPCWFLSRFFLSTSLAVMLLPESCIRSTPLPMPSKIHLHISVGLE